MVPMPLELRDSDTLRREVVRFAPTVIFHLASRPDGAESTGHAAAGIETNVMPTVHLLEISRDLPLEGFVFAGSSKVYGGGPVPHREASPTEPLSSYAASKLAAWHYGQFFSRIHDVPVVSLHPTLIYGPAPGANLFAFLARCLVGGKREIELDGGLQTRDPLYIDDAIEAYLLAGTRARVLKGRAIPIGGGRECTVKELAERFVAAAGHTTPVRACPERLRPTEMMRSYCDNLDARAAMDWEPEVSLEDGLLATARFLIPDAPIRA